MAEELTAAAFEGAVDPAADELAVEEGVELEAAEEAEGEAPASI